MPKENCPCKDLTSQEVRYIIYALELCIGDSIQHLENLKQMSTPSIQADLLALIEESSKSTQKSLSAIVARLSPCMD